MKPRFFESATEFRKWLAAHHTDAKELLVGFYKKSTGRPSMTWEESVDQALCFGWIDGIRKRANDESCTIRFTPRKPSGIWSSVNIKRVGELSRLRLMQPAGLPAFEKRDPEKSAVYAYENNIQKLDVGSEIVFRSNKSAWEFFQTQAPSYQKMACRWVMGAKQKGTKAKRLATLIEDSANHARLGFTTKWSKK